MRAIVARRRRSSSKASFTDFLVLSFILILAAALRAWGWDYGLPHKTARPDEEIVVEAVFQMFALGRPVPITFAYPSFAIYLNVAVLKLYGAFGQLLGNYDRTMDMLLDMVVFRPGLNYRIARLTSLFFGVGTIAATYALAKRAHGSKRAGWLAALLVATCLLHVIYSRFATVDVMATFFITLTLVLAVKAAQDQKLSSFLTAGVLVGLSASVKYNAAIVCLSLAVPVAAALFRLPSTERWPILGKLGAAGVVSGLAFFATSPYAVLRIDEVRRAMIHLSDILHGATGEPALWTHLRDTFPLGLGWPFYLAAMLGVARALSRRAPSDLALLGFAIPFYLSMAGVRLTYPRYVIPLVPVLAVVATGVVWSLLSRAEFRAIAVVPAVAVLAGPGLFASLAFDRLAAQRDTRLLATDWMGDNLPRRVEIGVCRGYGAPQVNEDRRRPPAFTPRAIPCTVEAVEELGAPYIVTHAYPPLDQRVDDDLMTLLRERGRVVAAFDPLDESSSKVPFFFKSDLFYLPFAGFGALSRGGPIVTVWQLDVASAEGGAGS